jgi:hypothetical protein
MTKLLNLIKDVLPLSFLNNVTEKGAHRSDIVSERCVGGLGCPEILGTMFKEIGLGLKEGGQVTASCRECSSTGQNDLRVA